MKPAEPHFERYKVRQFGGVIGPAVRFFIVSPLTPLFIGLSFVLGLLALLLLAREEEPQIIVPVVDIFVQMPGASAKEVEQRITKPMEKFLWEIPGIEYLYSTAMPGQAMTVVRFLVGWNEEDALIQLNQKLSSHFDKIPPGGSPPLLKARRIDDVPILGLTLHGSRFDSYALRRIASALDDELKQVPDVSEITLIGGERREVRVELDASRLTSYQIDPSHVVRMIQAANQQSRAGSYPTGNQEIKVETGGFLRNAQEVASVVVGVYAKQLVYLRDIARIIDGPKEATTYVLFGGSTDGHVPSDAASGHRPSELSLEPAVTLAIAKRKGTNAIVVANEVLRKVELLKGKLIPEGVQVTTTRNYGLTALEKSNELLYHMAIAVFGVTLLIGLVLGWRESVVVALAIPVTLALTLTTFYLLGFTLNRITLFALIFSIGILVDDPIVGVENIVRHLRMPENHGHSSREVTVRAVNEILSPLILVTLAVIAAVVPMAFVGGLMGPYMLPIPIGSGAAMAFSMMVSIIVTPWAAHTMLCRHVKGQTHRSHEGEAEDWSTRLYRRVMGPIIRQTRLSMIFLAGTSGAMVIAMALIATGAVTVKMLPFDNKSEFQVIIDMDEGTTLEQTAQVAMELTDAIRNEPEVLNYQIYVGTASPYNFNGLVRHYFLRQSPNEADIQVNLIHKEDRKSQSHDVAKRVRDKIQPIVNRYRARVKVAEVPPGPPVLQTLVAEIYGPNYDQQIENARRVQEIFLQTPGVVDVDSYMEADQSQLLFRQDHMKAALHGIQAEQISQVVKICQAGMEIGLLHAAEANEDVPIRVQLPLGQRANATSLRSVPLVTPQGNYVPLGELVKLERGISDKSIHHKNLLPVVYVTGDVAGVTESPVYAILALNKKLDAFKPIGGNGEPLEIWNTRVPFSTQKPAMKWDGEWHVTYEVFRDLGAAFAVVMLLIYALVVGWFRSFTTPLIIMSAIPLSLIGILPAHWAMGAFFTATSMIGFIAGAGIVVRNSIILVDFIKLRVKEGMPLAEAVIDAGAIRFRPMMLTAAAVVVGSSVILFDPIFQGLAISLMAGEVASLLLSRMAVPIIYYLVMQRRPADEDEDENEDEGYAEDARVQAQ
ncbi:Efflux RND transporter permease subunit [Gammaproteobacteria bacterium]